MGLQSPLRCRAYGVDHDGICLLIELGVHRVLLDCGLSDLSVLQRELADHPPDFVFCSHAHNEHVQGLMQLQTCYPELPIYMSEVTLTLVAANQDSVALPLNLHSLPWRSPIQIPHSPLQVQLFPAGHLPGAAAILLTYSTPERTYTVLYTGDFCRTNFRLTEGLNLESLRGAAPDVLILEGSYGTTQYPHHRQQEKQFLAALDHQLSQGRSILLLTPALGLAQEILVLLRSHHQFTGRDLDIWVDEPIAQVCDIYLEVVSHLPTAIQNFARHQPLFWDTQVLPRMQRLNHPPILRSGQSPRIVVSDRWPNWFTPSERRTEPWCVFWPERELQQLSLNPEQLESMPYAAVSYCLTEHNDGPNTLQFIHNIRPQHLVFMHGSPQSLEQLTSLVELQNRYQLHWPRPQSTVEFPLGDRFLQPSPPFSQPYLGEIQETEQHITLRFPANLTIAPQWLEFADTGMVEARWQGNDFCVQSLSQQQLSERILQAAPSPNPLQCVNCQHYRRHICQNSQSTLYQRSVSPEGYCSQYQDKSVESEGLG
ncbi:MAG: MBL fold metallo-hydrolase [Spirulina sp. SIO3F2]|nr:MBL fold metallo-hydrolase [Spirulina sp. SIO3F2]